MASILIEKGADVAAKTSRNFTPLHLAAKYNTGNTKVRLRRSKRRKSDKEFCKPEINENAKFKFIFLQVSNLLISRGAPVNAEGKNQLTPLHTACHHNNPEVALLLLKNGAEPKCLAKNNYTPLHIAGKYKNQNLHHFRYFFL